MKQAKIILRRALFLVLLFSMLLALFSVFERKTLTGAWNYTAKVGGFFESEEAHSFDVLGFGSSHMYCTLNPLSLYDTNALCSYVLSTQQQPVDVTYYYVKEALRNQSPSIVVLETYMYCLDDVETTSGVAHDALDPFPATLRKLEMIHAMEYPENKDELYLNFLKYHTRWKELTEADWAPLAQKRDPYRGYVWLNEAHENENGPVSYEDVTASKLTEHNLLWLTETVSLIQEQGVTPVLLFAPCNPTDEVRARVKYLKEYAAEHDLFFLDMNAEFENIGLNNQSDFYDSGHLNASGSKKATAFLAEYLQENFEIQKKQTDLALWQKDLQEYYS